MPDLPQELPKPLYQHRFAVRIVGRYEEEVPDGPHPSQDLHGHIYIVIVLHVIQADEARHVVSAVQRSRPLHFLIQAVDL